MKVEKDVCVTHIHCEVAAIEIVEEPPAHLQNLCYPVIRVIITRNCHPYSGRG